MSYVMCNRDKKGGQGERKVTGMLVAALSGSWWLMVACSKGCDVVVVWCSMVVGGVLACRLMRESGSEGGRDVGAREINKRAGERAFSRHVWGRVAAR